MLLPILGTSWVFGVLAVNDGALVFQYLFALLNSLQVSREDRQAGGWAVGSYHPRAGRWPRLPPHPRAHSVGWPQA